MTSPVIDVATLTQHSQRSLRSDNPCKFCGQSENLYWYHDTNSPVAEGRPGDCTRGRKGQCGHNGRMMLVDRSTMTVHNCRAKGSESVAKPVVEPKPAATPSAPVPAVSAAKGTADDETLRLLRELLTSNTGKMDADQVRAMIREELSAYVPPTPVVTRVVVEPANGEAPRAVNGPSHRITPAVLTILMQGLHVMMVGPAGTGKSTIAEQCAEAMQLPFAALSLSIGTTEAKIVGYMNAGGEYVPSLYRRLYENGGVFLLDEIDKCHPAVLSVLNQSLANKMLSCPDGMVKMHPDFRCVAAANTYGKGASQEYAGSTKMDAATLDRFEILTVLIDEAMENAICESIGGTESDRLRVMSVVRALRASAEDKGMRVVMSPRRMVGMLKMLRGGLEWNDAIEYAVRRGMTDQDWTKLSHGIHVYDAA